MSENNLLGYTKVPNDLLEWLGRRSISGLEMRLILVVVRKTCGWGKATDKISYSQFVKATGSGRRSVARALSHLVSKGTLVAESSKGRTTIYSIPDIGSDITDTSDKQGTSVISGMQLVTPMTPTIEILQKNKYSPNNTNTQVIEGQLSPQAANAILEFATNLSAKKRRQYEFYQ